MPPHYVVSALILFDFIAPTFYDVLQFVSRYAKLVLYHIVL
jgi:hypothetical protein